MHSTLAKLMAATWTAWSSVVGVKIKQVCHYTYLPSYLCTYLRDSTWALGRFWRFLSREVGVIRYMCVPTAAMVLRYYVKYYVREVLNPSQEPEQLL